MLGITALQANTWVNYGSLLVMVWFLLLLNFLYMLVLALMSPFKWSFASLALWLLLLLLLLLWWIGGLFTCLVTLVIARFLLLATSEWLLAMKLVYSCIIAITVGDVFGCGPTALLTL